MATPIKITAPLSGRQSRKFNEKINDTFSKRISSEEKNRMIELMNKIVNKPKK